MKLKLALALTLMSVSTAAFAQTATPNAADAQTAAPAGAEAPPEVLFRDVRVFDGTNANLSSRTNVLVRGNLIVAIGADSASPNATVIDGGGRTLMPGLINAHTHIFFSTIPASAPQTADMPYMTAVTVKELKATLMRGFTSIRDVGGPTIGLAKAVREGIIDGPRIWTSGAMISQTGGHGDFRLPSELPAEEGALSMGERIGAAAIADNADTVRKRSREQLALGATHIKLMAGGGVGSYFDPIDVTQYTVDELRAAVEAAENWGTYVAVHAYTPKAIRQALDAGVRVIEHGNMVDDATAKLMAEKGVWWGLQPLTDESRPTTYEEGSPRRIKQRQVYEGTETAYALAKKYKIKTAWGTDTLYSPAQAANEGGMLAAMVKWYTPAEALKMATHDNAELLALSGMRSEVQQKLGVVEVNALADLILVNGDPTADLSLVADADKNFIVIMKDGKIYKNMLAN
jgi:imidazolonepropionase-like amidohydrolase